jgi:hypothetical protein
MVFLGSEEGKKERKKERKNLWRMAVDPVGSGSKERKQTIGDR